MSKTNHDFRKHEIGIFLREELDSPNQLEGNGEIRFCAHAAIEGSTSTDAARAS
jgi:hypothetical protein